MTRGRYLEKDLWVLRTPLLPEAFQLARLGWPGYAWLAACPKCRVDTAMRKTCLRRASAGRQQGDTTA